jgi:hypothetical protein
MRPSWYHWYRPVLIPLGITHTGIRYPHRRCDTDTAGGIAYQVPWDAPRCHANGVGALESLSERVGGSATGCARNFAENAARGRLIR